ncbi:MAG: NAD-binding protein [Anaerolineales bacterium]|nr:NAD-binding protein [Anaerolineales bacterium]
MNLDRLFSTTEYLNEAADMKVMQEVIERMGDEKPLKGSQIVVGHLLAINSLTMVEALYRGGADFSISVTREFVKKKDVGTLLDAHQVPILSPEQAARAGDFFLDEAATLGKMRTPKGAAEITRTGDLAYQDIPCPTISVDMSKVKRFEDFYGTGDSFVRAWKYFKPDQPLAGKKLILFGYGKVGKGVASQARKERVDITVVDINPDVLARAEQDGFKAVNSQSKDDSLRDALATAEIIVGVTGIPGIVGKTVPPEWLLANKPSLVNMGYDEFGPIGKEYVVGGGGAPYNLYLPRPSLNCYIDPALAAQVLAIETLIKNPENFTVGVQALPDEIDNWILETWFNAWPDRDHSEIQLELGLN